MGLGVTLDAAIALVISIVATAALVSLRLVWSRVARPPRRGIGFHEHGVGRERAAVMDASQTPA
jgi:hypothetical protein